MTVNDLALGIGSLVIGIITSIWVSAYYFRKSVTKSLTPFLHYASSPLNGIASDVKRDLKITYQGAPVQDFFEAQFIVANTGEKAIRDLIEPLGFVVPEGSTLLDAVLIHRSPIEFQANIEVDTQRKGFKVNFPLMNSGDFFILKVLLDGTPKLEQLRFTILVDELPRTLKISELSFGEVSTTGKPFWTLRFTTLAGLFITFLGIAVSKLVYDALQSSPSIFTAPLEFDSVVDLHVLALVSSAIAAFLIISFGVMTVAVPLFSGSLRPVKRKFVVPEGVMKAYVQTRFGAYHDFKASSPDSQKKA